VYLLQSWTPGVGVREIDDDEGRRLVRLVHREPLVIIWV
jgi:hypothetical protein